MIRIKSERVVLVAPATFSVELLPSNKHIRHIQAVENIFPAIHEIKPNIILFDYGLLGKDSEKLLRRLRSNGHYKTITIYCYKDKYQPKADDLLKYLGVDRFIYQSDLDEQERNQPKNVANLVVEAIVALMIGTVAY